MTPEDAALLVVLVAAAIVLVRVLPWIALALVALLGLAGIVAVSYAARAYERARGWVGAVTSPSEDASDRDGFLSHVGEWHAVTTGLSIGVLSGIAGVPWLALLVLGGFVVLGMIARFSGPRQVVTELNYALVATVAGYGIVDVLAGLLA